LRSVRIKKNEESKIKDEKGSFIILDLRSSSLDLCPTAYYVRGSDSPNHLLRTRLFQHQLAALLVGW